MDKKKPKKKNPAAVALGRLGGKVKTAKGFAKMERDRLAEVGRKGGLSKSVRRRQTGTKAHEK